MENMIFINYRSCDAPYPAQLIDAGLTARFGPEQVFRDSRSIRLGTDFPPEIARALQQCHALIAVIGRHWLRERHDGRRLIDDPGDYVRREIAEALRRNVLVIPVLVADASLPSRGLLPPDIAGLATRQYTHLGIRNAQHDIARLVDELAELLGEAGLPAGSVPAPGQPPSNTVSNTFHGPVDARHSVFGNVFRAR